MKEWIRSDEFKVGKETAAVKKVVDARGSVDQLARTSYDSMFKRASQSPSTRGITA